MKHQEELDKFIEYKGKLPEYVKSEEDFQLFRMRHSAEHVLMQAMFKVFGKKNIIMALGPAIENGFYFDFDSPKGFSIKEEDFEKIETEINNIIKENQKFDKQEVSIEEAKELFKDNPYKQEWIGSIKGRNEKVTIYRNIDDNGNVRFEDLCKGPHVNSTGEIGVVKLLSIAGAYWHGDEKNKMLTRVYGIAFGSQKDLDDYLHLLQEAKERDHRKIGKEQDLFLISEDVGGGLPIFTPKGMQLRQSLLDFIVNEKKQRGYQFVWTPNIAKSDLYKKSGHWDRYDAMYKPMQVDDEEYVVKPMNCPHHFQIFLNKKRSYRELPMRIAENGTCYRYEKSGELSGLLRVRALTVDDTHHFVRHSDIAGEIDMILGLVEHVFKTLGFTDYSARISVRGEEGKKIYQGSEEVWKIAEDALKQAVEKRNIDYYVAENEAAFYGPKIDVVVKDVIGREWQLSTVQLDFNQPENFDMKYVNEDGKEERPAILHVAILGSFERFLGIAIEQFAGAFPAWLSPLQIKILPISEEQFDFARKLKDQIEEIGEGKAVDPRIEVDERSETLQAKIRDAANEKVPYTLVVGRREAEAGKVAVRVRGKGDIGAIAIEEFVDKFINEVKERKLESAFV